MNISWNHLFHEHPKRISSRLANWGCVRNRGAAVCCSHPAWLSEYAHVSFPMKQAMKREALKPLCTGLLPHSHLTDRPLLCFWCYHKLQQKFAFSIQIEKMTKYVKEYINRNNTVRQLRHHLCLIWPILSFFCPKLWAHFGRIWDCNHSAVTCVSERHHVKVSLSNQSFFSSQDQHESA